ncbi:MAG TPA: carboxymuconolactone decarboxylase family protein [Steroidobacteraceae bacterium]|nr:carboxymuconolactone decarboxylase family protein [Steroidobacteraceae bacterium]
MATFSPRLIQPRVPPVGKDGRTPAQDKMLAGRPDYNVFKTLAHDPELFERWNGLGLYLLNGSTLPPRDREIVILRMGWLCQAPYEWSQHARIAKASVNMTDAELHAIAAGAASSNLSDFERTLIRMTDELRYDTEISDATWAALRTRYSVEQTIDAIYTAGQYQLVSMALNSLGVQLDPELQERMPPDLKPPQPAAAPELPRLAKPRIKPLTLEAMTAEQRQLVAPQLRDGKVPNLYATLVVHTRFYEPRLRFGSYIQRDSRLPPQTRELLILRTAWLARSEYEWAHHVVLARAAGLGDAEIASVALGPRAGNWSDEQRALLQAADELRREAFMSEAAWKTLTQHYDTAKMLEIIYTVGGYAMTAMAINSLGIQLEDGYPRVRNFGK